MKTEENNNRPKFIFAGIIFIALIIIVLFSGTAVNKYYKIQTPEPGRVIESIPGFSRRTLDPESVKILNWNIYKGRRDGWEEDFKRLAREEDIILIQEARIEDKNHKNFGIRYMGGNFARSFSYHKGAVSATGVITLSKARPVSAAYLRTRSKEPLTHTPKVSLLTEYSFKNSKKTLLVVNIHGINFVRSAAFESQLIDLEKKIKGHQGPIIFAGDFNTWNKKRMLILSKITKHLELKEARFFPDARTKRFRYFIDHVFYRELKIKQSKVFKDIRSSDHKAMEIEFYLAAP